MEYELILDESERLFVISIQDANLPTIGTRFTVEEYTRGKDRVGPAASSAEAPAEICDKIYEVAGITREIAIHEEAERLTGGVVRYLVTAFPLD